MEMQSLSLGFSPCPNDTFLFYGLLHGKTSLKDMVLNITQADVQELNESVQKGVFDVSKASFFTIAQLLHDYTLLPVGAALGRGNGPKLVAKEAFDLRDLSHKSMVLPGKNTTAHLLQKIMLPQPKEEHFCLYNEVAPMIAEGSVDCGMIIHETRFMLKELGLVEICDLGQMWEAETKLPLPLGGLIAKRSLGLERIDAITKALQESLRYAWDHPQEVMPYALQHSIEKDPLVVRAHIDLYVNEESYGLSQQGQEAIQVLFKKAEERGLLHS